MARKRTLYAIANERISFDKAMQWAGQGTVTRERVVKVTCPSCDEADAMRVLAGKWLEKQRRGNDSSGFGGLS